MNKCISILMVLFFKSIIIFSQENIPYSLKPGEAIPDVRLALHERGESKIVKLSDYDDRVIILDFWSTTCSSCIQGMPDMVRLEEQLKGRLKVIVVTENSKEEIDKLWKNLSKTSLKYSSLFNAANKLSFVIADTFFTKLFPHNGIPLHVWVDKNREFKNIAYPSTTTVENINLFIKGESFDLDEYQNRQNFDPLSLNQWFSNLYGVSDEIQRYSVLMGRIDVGGTSYRNRPIRDTASNEIIGFTCINKRVIDLFKLAYFKYPNNEVPDYYVKVDVPDSVEYFKFSGKETKLIWERKYVYSYAIKIPLIDTDCLYKLIINDLETYFKVKSSMQVRSVKCYVLKNTSSGNRIISKGGASVNARQIINSELFYVFRNTSFNDLLARLNISYSMPLINETNYNHKNMIDLNLPWQEGANELDLEFINKGLKLYGIELVEDYRKINVLVLTKAAM